MAGEKTTICLNSPLQPGTEMGLLILTKKPVAVEDYQRAEITVYTANVEAVLNFLRKSGYPNACKKE